MDLVPSSALDSAQEKEFVTTAYSQKTHYLSLPRTRQWKCPKGIDSAGLPVGARWTRLHVTYSFLQHLHLIISSTAVSIVLAIFKAPSAELLPSHDSFLYSLFLGIPCMRNCISPVLTIFNWLNLHKSSWNNILKLILLCDLQPSESFL